MELKKKSLKSYNTFFIISPVRWG